MSSNEVTDFTIFNQILDNRLLRVISDLGFARPTLVQQKVVPLTLEGRDILARARTGSGKTMAYCLPLLQKILKMKEVDTVRKTRGLILVPTRELSDQVTKHLKDLLVYCEKEVIVGNVSSSAVTHVQRNALAGIPDVIVATPSRILNLVQSKEATLENLDTLVIDEADLIFSFGHGEDMQRLMKDGHLPKVFQSLLMSATMTKDVESLRGLVLRDPVILELDEHEDEAANLSQFVVRTPEVDKFLLIYVMLKLKLIKGKCLIFVNDVDRCYRLKLFLEQFAIRSCVLNSELPLNSRVHIVREFNMGIYDYIIATDESAGKGDAARSSKESAGAELLPTDRNDDVEGVADQEAEGEEETNEASGSSKKRKRGIEADQPTSRRKKGKQRSAAKDKEYGVTRGIDFIEVACVLNFDLPITSQGYTHRVGRTARAGRTGMALSFVVPQSEYGKNRIVGSVPSTREDETIWERIEKDQTSKGSKITDYNFDKSKIEAFRYRMEDALRSVTKIAIKEGRLKDLKNEVLKSDKLKAHFEDNPLDLEYLKHDKPLHPTRIQPHMKNVPKYLLPNNMTMATTGMEAEASSSKDIGFVPFKKQTSSRGRGRQRGGRFGGSGGKRKKNDPLKKFK